MKKFITTTLAAGLVASVYAADVTLDLASAYVFRGVTFNDGAVFQPGIETGLPIAEEYGSLAIGAWGNYDIDDYDDSLNSSEFSEVDLYVGYGLPALIDGVDLSLGWCEYTYPTSGVADKEASIGAGFGVGDIALGLTAYFGVGGGINGTQYYELTAGYDVEIDETLSASFGASIAYVDFDGGDNGMHDGSLSAALSYALNDSWSLGASVAYIAQLDDEILVDVEDGGGYDVDFVGSIGLSCSM